MSTRVVYVVEVLSHGSKLRGAERVLTVTHEYDPVGRHRLVLGDGWPVHGSSNWCDYQSVAELAFFNGLRDRVFLGFTEYYGERVVEARELARQRS